MLKPRHRTNVILRGVFRNAYFNFDLFAEMQRFCGRIDLSGYNTVASFDQADNLFGGLVAEPALRIFLLIQLPDQEGGSNVVGLVVVICRSNAIFRHVFF
jgi:hypothetical protein